MLAARARVRRDAQVAEVDASELVPGDIVLLLGKGHEGCIIYGTEQVPWDEPGAARAALQELGYK